MQLVVKISSALLEWLSNEIENPSNRKRDF